MSGIAGHIRFDGAPVGLGHLKTMTRKIAHRGPDGINYWVQGSVGLGHCLLRTTEEAEDESQPLVNEDQNIILVMDGWLQNWVELRSELLARGVHLRTRADSELVLRAYETWGRDCLGHLHGDFAFVIWNGRRREAFCARDRIGMRPFYYYHSSAVGLCFASDPEALLAMPGVPCKLNEGRVADLIAGGLEGYDSKSTFYLDIKRLPAAHMMDVTARGAVVDSYWRIEPPKVLRLRSNRDYEEAFRATLQGAVTRSLRGNSTVGAMLSGGLDSGSITAMARRIRMESGGPPLPTFSAIGPDPCSCPETASIHASVGMKHIAPHFIDHSLLEREYSELVNLALEPCDPFDRYMSLIRAVYFAGHQMGMKSMLDGGGADVVLDPGAYLTRFLQKGHIAKAWREARSLSNLSGAHEIIPRNFLAAARRAWTPDWLRRGRRWIFQPCLGTQDPSEQSLISESLARKVGLGLRYEQAGLLSSVNADPASVDERIAKIFRPQLVAGRERYERVAARAAIEPRDPFLNLDMVKFCLSLPVQQLVGNGWRKLILRRAMLGELPQSVRWRKGRTHLGPAFTAAVMAARQKEIVETLLKSREQLAEFIDIDRFCRLLESYRQDGNLTAVEREQLWSTYAFCSWLSRRFPTR